MKFHKNCVSCGEWTAAWHWCSDCWWQFLKGAITAAGAAFGSWLLSRLTL